MTSRSSVGSRSNIDRVTVLGLVAVRDGEEEGFVHRETHGVREEVRAAFS